MNKTIAANNCTYVAKWFVGGYVDTFVAFVDTFVTLSP